MSKRSGLLADFARASDRLLLVVADSTFADIQAAYESLKRDYLKLSKNPSERLEIRRRVAENLLRAAAREAPTVLLRHLERLERLGYSSVDGLVWACSVASRSGGDPEVRARLLRMMRRAERMMQSQRFPAPYLSEQKAVLRRIRIDLCEHDST